MSEQINGSRDTDTNLNISRSAMAFSAFRTPLFIKTSSITNKTIQSVKEARPIKFLKEKSRYALISGSRDHFFYMQFLRLFLMFCLQYSQHDIYHVKYLSAKFDLI